MTIPAVHCSHAGKLTTLKPRREHVEQAKKARNGAWWNEANLLTQLDHQAWSAGRNYSHSALLEIVIE